MFIKSRKRAPFHRPARSATPTLVGATMLGSLALALPAMANDAITTVAQVATAKSLPGISVNGIAGDDYRVDQLSSPKFTQPLLDTTQTISVISKEVIQQQGATTLAEALRNSPGVGTFYVGENGATNTGDAVFMRGFDTSGSIFVDGVRDLGSVSRDMFNVEQVEVTKGPDGTEYGRTAPTGAVNLVSKQPGTRARSSGSASYGSGTQKRVTADWNLPLAEQAAFRLNVMGQDSGVTGRDRVRNRRWGLAPALAFGLGTPTRVYLDYLHIKQDNVPDGGVSSIGLPGYSSPDSSRPFLGDAPAVDPGNFYGTRQDHDRVDADMFTALVTHDFSDTVTLRDTLRWGRTQQDYLLTSFLANAANLVTPDPGDPATWTVARSNPTFKHQTNRIVANQTNLSVRFATGAMVHDLSAGIELSREQASTLGMAVLAGSAWPAANLYHPDASVGGLKYASNGADATGKTSTAAVYVFDTLKFNRQWQVNAGARLDHYRSSFRSAVVCGGRNTPVCGALPSGSVVPGIDARIGDNLPNYKLGVLYKPVANGSIYANIARSQNPPGGDTLAFSSSAKSLDNPNLDPQQAHTVEVGSKWDLFGEKLLLTGALYRTTITNLLAQDPLDPTRYHQVGKQRVQGVELTAVGRLTENWAVSAGFTTMDTKVVNGDQVAEDGSSALAYTPKSAFTTWTTYRLPFNLTLGGGARYAGALKRGTDGAIGTPAFTEAYWVFDAMASYPLNPHLDVQLNLYNLFDRHYVAAINKSGYRYTPGTPRAAMLTVNFRY